MQLVDARDFDQPGLKIVSNYQYGKADTADWLGGPAAGVRPANRDWELHFAAGGSYGAAIYASIDDDPTCEQEKQLVAPYIRGWESVLGRHRVGRYANSKAIESALQDGLGSWFWQHNWGPPGWGAHPAAHRHQVEVDTRQVAGVRVDINHIHTPRFGRWDCRTLPTSKICQQTSRRGRRGGLRRPGPRRPSRGRAEMSLTSPNSQITIR